MVKQLLRELKFTLCKLVLLQIQKKIKKLKSKFNEDNLTCFAKYKT